MKLLWIAMIVGSLAALSGCENRKPTQDKTIAEDTDIKERPFGGTEIEKKELIEKENGQRELREQETKFDDEGRVTEQETETKRPNEGTEVDVRGGDGGVSVDVKTPDNE